MTEMEHRTQIALGEDSRNQIKRNETNAVSLVAGIATFANFEGGAIYLGVADGGSFPGLNRADVVRIKHLIGNAASQHVFPPEDIVVDLTY